MSGETITLYGIIISPPVRTVAMFCKLNNIPYEHIKTNPLTGETKTPEYLAIAPTGNIPALTHGDFTITEAFAICGYLANVFSISNQWWPTELRTKIKVIEYLHWHHGNIRNCGKYIFHAVFSVKFFKSEPNEEKINESKLVVEKALTYIEGRIQLTGCVAGTSELSVADLACYSEVSGLKMADWDFTGYPQITAWMQRIEQIEVVQIINQEFEELIKSLAS